jgi:hypothetical protein
MNRKCRSFQCINRIWATQLLNGPYDIFVALVPWGLNQKYEGWSMYRVENGKRLEDRRLS